MCAKKSRYSLIESSFRHQFTMEEQPVEEGAETSKWVKIKKNLAVNKPLIPLKLTMLFYYGSIINR